MTWSRSARALWAKTGDDGDWLNLPRHMMDSAAVGAQLWSHWVPSGLRQSLEDALDLRDEGEKFASWIAGVHDSGKATPCFQGQLRGRGDRYEYADRVENAGLTLGLVRSKPDWYPHSTGSELILCRWLESRVQGRRVVNVRHLAAIAGAHHGLPSSSTSESAGKAEIEGLDEQWKSVQDELVEGITAFTDAEDVVLRVAARGTPRWAQMVLTGFVIMADWIASNQDYFPLSPDDAVSSRDRASDALSDLVLTPPITWSTSDEDASVALAQRFHWPSQRTALPAQVAAIEAARAMDGAGILCLEAPMGSGKTEAALAVAEVMAEKTGRGGVMIAAPTMATSDALLTRVKAWAASAVGDTGVASLFLGHSKADLNEDMREIRQRTRRINDVGSDRSEKVHGDSIVAHQWLSGRKKGILSNVVVGTVDQVLFLALQAKHAMLRHLGLAGKVVIIDEVHAYDSYMGQYLGRALEWLGAYGVPVVLLSATLPQDVKANLIAQYQEGLRRIEADPGDVPVSGEAYPVVTVADRSGMSTIPVEAPQHQTGYALEQIGDDEEDLVEVMRLVADQGGTLLVLCNTVNRAQQAFEWAQSLIGDDARLLHARFVAADRVTLERELVSELGPPRPGAVHRPTRRIVVATQVVEQSLDVDFDGMVTDIAPMDLVLQRCGRVHRHVRPNVERPSWAKSPQIWVRGMVSPGSEETPPDFVAVQEKIYSRALLLKTWALLRKYTEGQRPELELPFDIPSLVQRTYGDDPVVPHGWSEALAVAEKDLGNEQYDARQRADTFRFPPPMHPASMRQLWQDQRADLQKDDAHEARGLAQVRDTDPTLEVLLTQSAEGGYRMLPWMNGAETINTATFEPSDAQAYGIAASSIRLPFAFSYPDVFDEALMELEKTTDIGWHQSRILKGQLQLMLDDDFTTTLAGRFLRYDQKLGLIDETPRKGQQS